jgi:hypothetical protein
MGRADFASTDRASGGVRGWAALLLSAVLLGGCGGGF